MGGGAWPFLVGGAICLVNSDNERDSGLLTSPSIHTPWRGGLVSSSSVAGGGRLIRAAVDADFLEGQVVFSHARLSNNRSVMPLDVLGRTRATLKESTCSTILVR